MTRNNKILAAIVTTALTAGTVSTPAMASDILKGAATGAVAGAAISIITGD